MRATRPTRKAVRRAALGDLLRAARLGIVAGQQAYQLGRLPARASLSGFYLRRARERLAEARGPDARVG